MRWIGRLFDERDTFFRLLLLDLSGLGYLIFRPAEARQPTPVQWLLAVAAFVAALALHRWPMGNLAVQTVLLVFAFWLLDDPLINQVGSSWALLEVTMWARRPAAVYSVAAALSGVYLGAELIRPRGTVAGALFGLVVVVGLPVLIGLNVRNARALARQVEQQAADEQRRRESENRAARAAERSTIARELHDVVAHHVASMVLRVAVARHVLPGADPRVAEVFDDVHGTGTAALAELRQLVTLLRDPAGVRPDAALTAVEPAALPAALRAAADRAQRAGLTVHVDIAPQFAALDTVRGLAVLRLTQEALTNVARHAGPTATARLSVGVRDGELHWQVSDDGRPAGTPVAPPGGGHGLTGMRERVEVLGGRLSAGPEGPGWRVSTVLPLPEGATSDGMDG